MDLPIVAATPDPIAGRARLRALADMWFVDHGFIRDIYLNLHRISDKAWRSAQPGPNHWRRLKKLGIRTVVNLRGRRDTCGSYILEREGAAKAGLTLIDFPIRSRGALEKPTLKAAAELFPRLDYPVLFHCKSGADRAGMMATLYLHLHERVPLERAMDQLSLRFGHVKWAKTGVIDHFFARYRDHARRETMPLMEWVDKVYDRAEMDASFHENRFARFSVDVVLRRE